MNYYNVFIIIFIIDIIIFIAEGIVFYTFEKDLLLNENQNQLKGRLSNIRLYINNGITNQQHAILNSNQHDEETYISRNITLSIVYFVVFIVGLFILAGIYIFIITRWLKKNIEYHHSLIVVCIATVFIIIIEISSIFLTLNKLKQNYVSQNLWINNTLLDKLG